MATPAYTPYNSAIPDGSHTPTVVVDTEVINKERSLRDMSIVGGVKGFIQSRTLGTGVDLTHPQFISWINGTLGFRWNMTWTGDKVTTITYEWSNDQGSTNTWVAMSTAQVNTFDAAYNITASTNSGGFVDVVLEVWAKVLKVVGDVVAHIAATGTAVHGLGTMSTQNKTAVDVDGGNIDATKLGVTTPDDGDFTRVREKFNAYASAGAGATTTFELDKYGGFSGQPHATTSSTWVVAVSGAPAANKIQVWELVLVNAVRDIDGRITWPGSFKWVGGAAARPPDNTLATSGRNIFSLSTYDGGVTYDITHLGVRG